ncbi:hypothetical protein [Paenibacillus sp. USHLN196]|uniref:hypothetical protein n=1 Tax=Paenibacillus sp. USHLN196 TaxID=3081291 RepID=UPI00301A29ED
MDARDHLNNQVIEIIEELANKQKSRLMRRQQLHGNQNNQSVDNKVVPIRPDLNDRINKVSKTNDTPQKEEIQSLKSLLAARHNLESLKERLNKDSNKNKTELEKLSKVEVKLNSSIVKAQRKEITLAIDNLKREPRRFVLKLADIKSKIELLKTKLENNPRLYKMHYEKIEKLEIIIDRKINNTQTRTLRSAINNIQKNPEKYRQEIDRYDEMEKTLNKGLSQNNQNNMQKDKENEKNQKQERTRDDLELSR